MKKTRSKKVYVKPILRVLKDKGDFYSPSTISDWDIRRLNRNYGSIIGQVKSRQT